MLEMKLAPLSDLRSSSTAWWEECADTVPATATVGQCFKVELHRLTNDVLKPDSQRSGKRCLTAAQAYGLQISSSLPMTVNKVTSELVQSSGIKPGDVLIGVGSMPVKRPSDVDEALASLHEMGAELSAQVRTALEMGAWVCWLVLISCSTAHIIRDSISTHMTIRKLNKNKTYDFYRYVTHFGD